MSPIARTKAFSRVCRDVEFYECDDGDAMVMVVANVTEEFDGVFLCFYFITYKHIYLHLYYIGTTIPPGEHYNSSIISRGPFGQ